MCIFIQPMSFNATVSLRTPMQHAAHRPH